MFGCVTSAVYIHIWNMFGMMGALILLAVMNQSTFVFFPFMSVVLKNYILDESELQCLKYKMQTIREKWN